jgi:Domain of unknown function (DUF4397)
MTRDPRHPAGRSACTVTRRSSALRAPAAVTSQPPDLSSAHTTRSGTASGQFTPRTVPPGGAETVSHTGSVPAASSSSGTTTTVARPGGPGVEGTATPLTRYRSSTTWRPAAEVGAVNDQRCSCADDAGWGATTPPSYAACMLVTRGEAYLPAGTPAPATRRSIDTVSVAGARGGVQARRSSTTRSPLGCTRTVTANPGPDGAAPMPGSRVAGGLGVAVEGVVRGDVAARIGPACERVCGSRTDHAYPTVPSSAAATTAPIVHDRAEPLPSQGTRQILNAGRAPAQHQPRHRRGARAGAAKGAVMNTRPGTRRRLGAGLSLAVLASLLAGVGAIGVADAAPSGQVYVLQGLPGRSVDLFLNGKQIGADIAPKTIVGPLSLAAGSYQLRVADPGATNSLLQRTVTVGSGASLDAVVHLDAEASPTPKLTVFANDRSPVVSGKTRLAIAHVAAVPAADIRVGGKVLFSNVANGEGLTTVVPAGSYSVDVVPTGTNGPAVLGPATFTLTAATLTRVFAVGQPSRHTMDAIVQVIPLGVDSAAAPGTVNTGSGGAAARVDHSAPLRLALVGAGVLLLVGAGASLWRRRRIEPTTR